MTHEPSRPRPILIIDPEESERRLTADVLARGGYRTVESSGGEEALDIGRREQPCAVVLEVCLGEGISGYEVCRELREAFGEDLVIVFVSGIRTESFDRVAGLLLGADDYIVKPFAADELLARVRRLVRRSPRITSNGASKLTPRERDVLQLLVEGLEQKRIASRLFISRNTVGSHIEHIYRKLGAHSRGEAIAAAYRDELIGRNRFQQLAIAPLAMGGSDLFDWFSASWALFGG